MHKLPFPHPQPPRNDAEEGQGLVEYGMILLFIAIVVIVILTVLGPQIGSMFSAVSSKFK